MGGCQVWSRKHTEGKEGAWGGKEGGSAHRAVMRGGKDGTNARWKDSPTTKTRGEVVRSSPKNRMRESQDKSNRS